LFKGIHLRAGKHADFPIRYVIFIAVLYGMVGMYVAAIPAQDESDPVAVFREGKLALQSGQLNRAESSFRRVIVLDPKSGAAHTNLGVTLMREKRWDDALAELHTASSLSPNEPGVLLNTGLVYYRRNDFASAIEPFSATLRLAPNSRQARYLLGLCYFFTNSYKDAAAILEPLWDQEASNLNYLYVLSIAAGKSTNAALQKKAFDRMLAVGQDKPEFHLYVGKAFLAEHDTGKALAEFNAAVETKPDMPMVHYFLGRAYLEQRAYAEAERELMEDATLEPEFAYNYEDLAILYVRTNQPEKAEAYFRKAIERNNLLVNSYYELAKLYQDGQRYAEALDMVDHAIALAWNSAGVHYTRGQILKHLGRVVDAKQEFQTSARMFKTVNDRIQQDPSGDRFADAQDAVQE
jgi:tetratricopeptide (TPR) repeat protein